MIDARNGDIKIHVFFELCCLVSTYSVKAGLFEAMLRVELRFPEPLVLHIGSPPPCVGMDSTDVNTVDQLCRSCPPA